MATTSFNKNFVVSDASGVKQLKADLKQPRKVVVREYDRVAEDKKGIELFKQRFSDLANC